VSILLRDVSGDDAAWSGGWLPSVAASVGHEGAGDTKSGRGKARATTRIIERDGERAGVLIYRLHARKRGAAIIELIATPPAYARRGSGMKAAALLEDELRARGVREIFAPAPAAHGIAMYFWIRLGYRPLKRDAWPCAREDVAWLVRRIDGR
jgi:GNAT superfamily N-acetyltransferase